MILVDVFGDETGHATTERNGVRWRRLGLLAACVLAAGAPAASASAAEYQNRIVGGSAAAPNAWPSQAHITGSQGILLTGCGGSLLSARYVITAAHCVNNSFGGTLAASAFTVRLGSNQSDSGGKEHAVDVVTRHEGWTSSTTENDLALLHLTEPATQEPMTLIGEDEAPLWAEGVTATIIGWGLTSTGGSGSTDLLQATVPMVGDARCAEVWGRTFKPANQVCAGGTGTDSCQGDSGGPLLVQRDGTWATAGIVSYGTSDGCATQGTPSVYTRIGAPQLNQWIRARVPTLRLTTGSKAPRAGTGVVLGASASGPAAPSLNSITWDLDGDGAFDDATGAEVPAVFAAGPRMVRAALALPDGDRATAAIRLDVGAARTVPGGVRANGTQLAAVPAPFSSPAGGGARLQTEIAAPTATFALSRLRGSRLRAAYSCDAACTSRGTLVVTAATARRLGLRSRTLATGSGRLTGAGITDVALKVPATVRRRLVKARSVRAELRVKVRVGGRVVSLKRAVTGRATR